MLSKEDLAKMAEKYQAKADDAFRNYQETGITRYDRERRKNEELADAISAAAAAAETRQAYSHLRADIVWHAARLDKAVYNDAAKDELVAIVKGFVDMAAVMCNYRRLSDE